MAVARAQDESVDRGLIEGQAPSIGEMLRRRAREQPDETAFQYFADPDSPALTDVTWAQARDVAYEIAAGLIALGVDLEDRVALASGTRIEWALVDLGIMCAGAATTTIYPTTGDADVLHILRDSGSVVAIVEDGDQVAKVLAHRSELPELRQIVVIEPGAPADRAAEDDAPPTDAPHDASGDAADGLISLDDLRARGRAQDTGAGVETVDTRIDQVTKDHLATLMYTSGTTARPKGVRLAHEGFCHLASGVEAVGLLSRDDLQYLWLPLSHVFGKLLLALPLATGFPTTIDGRIDKIVDNLAIVRPTFMGAAPRIFEKAHARIAGMFEQETGVKAGLISWALAVGEQASQARLRGEQPSGVLAAKLAVADRLVLGKVRERFGGRIRFFISGSAPLSPEIARWFGSVGLLVCEGYGLTETTAATTVNRPSVGSYTYGSVGWPLPGMEISVADDGEILVRGPAVMRGYHNLPTETAEALTDDGWLRTGDIGEVDERGFVRITDRKKDLFKTSGGKYIAPSVIETRFKGLCPYASQFMVYGAGHNYATAVVTLDPDVITGWAAGNGMAGHSYPQIVASAAARDLIQGYVDTLNSELNRWETIKRFTILGRDLSVEDGELTPSLKLKRRVVETHFADELAALYTGD